MRRLFAAHLIFLILLTITRLPSLCLNFGCLYLSVFFLFVNDTESLDISGISAKVPPALGC